VDYLEFKKWFTHNVSVLKRPKDCSELVAPVSIPVGNLFWTFDWVLAFSDKKYLRIRERYESKPGMIGESYRVAFAYHYGTLLGSDNNGRPIYQPKDPVDIRIDCGSQDVHLHYLAPNPHLSQDRIIGLDLHSLDMFRFIKAIFRHRTRGVAIDKTLKFRII
jgi:hypothetical protein